jgi:hypothetical protein
MRLGQLARQLEIKPEKIVSFLQKDKNITIKSHPNSKVDDDLIEVITTHFKPVVEEEIIAVQKEKVIAKETKEEAVESVKEDPKPIEHIETVKATPAQELKIIGKIDLPNKKDIQVEVDGVVYDQETLDEKKKEEQKAEKERKAIEKEAKRKEEDEKRRIAREKREVEAERQAMLKTEKHNLLSKEEERKKAIILKAQQEREERLEAKRKEKQAAHYAQQVASKPTAKKKKKAISKATPELAAAENLSHDETPEVKVEEVRETSIYKRFIKWLNT